MAACTPDVWPNTDTPYITVCDADEDILIDLDDVDITATENFTRGNGILGLSQGDPSGDVIINVRGGRVQTSGRSSPGIRGQSRNSNVTVNVQGVSITTDSTSDTRQDHPSSGITALINTVIADSPDGKISITAKDVAIMTSGGRSSHGFYGYNTSKKTDDSNTNTDIDIDIEDSSITTEGSLAHGILGEHLGDGNVNIDVQDSNIISGDYHGIFGLRGLLGDRADTAGDINIDVGGGSITTKAYLSHGIYAKNEGITKTIYDYTLEDYVSYVVNGYATGDINIDVQGVIITTDSTDVGPDTLRTESHGIYGRHQGKGDINIDVQDGTTITTRGVNSYGVYGYHEDVLGDGTPGSNGDINIDIRDSSITTMGEGAYGIYGRHQGEGDIDIDVVNTPITTTGINAHGIVAHYYGTAQPTSSIAINAGGSINVSGAGAQGIRVGRVNADGAPEGVAAIGADGYRRHTVTVNGAVTSNAEGVILAGGGKVVIGPGGSIASNSGIAILATGDTPGADPANDPPIKPKLRVDFNLNGRVLPQVIGDDWIINDGGETAIVVNGVLLHDGATRVVADAVVPNGAWNVTMREEGVNVTDYSDPDPANWETTERAAGIFADRDFSAEDFIEVYAPRAAVYEALPGFLLRLDEGLLSGKPVFSSGSPVWARLSGGRGSYEAAHASVGAQFDYGGFAAEAGLDFSMDENAVGSVSVRRIAGSADVTAPTGGGKIETEGFGVALGVSLNWADAYYARGRFSFADYTADFTSGELGRLATGVGARAHTLDIEAGRHVAMRGGVNLTPRFRLANSGIVVDSFTDAVDSRVSVVDANRFTGRLGVAAAVQDRKWRGGALSAGGSVDLEQTFGGATSVDVSGTPLSSEPAKTRLLLGFGPTYRRGPVLLGAEVSAGGLGSGDEQYSGSVTFGFRL